MNREQTLTVEEVIKMMESSYTLVCVESCNNLNDSLDVISECVKSKSSTPLNDYISEWFSDCEEDIVVAIIDGLKNECDELGYSEQEIEEFFDEHDDDIRAEIYNRDDSNRVDEVIGYTDLQPIRVELHSNYDCINSHCFEVLYSYQESYFGDMVNALNLNPSKVKEIFEINEIECLGEFPNLSERNGLEVVSYEDFTVEILNSITPVNLLTFLGKVSVAELYDKEFNVDTITIPKGNECGLYSSSQGGGSAMSMKLQRDLTIKLSADKYDYYSLEIDGDKERGHSMKCVYGLIDDAFGELIKIEDKEESVA